MTVTSEIRGNNKRKGKEMDKRELNFPPLLFHFPNFHNFSPL